MNALVGYGSSDEEEDDDVSPPRPAKIAKLDDNPPEHLTAPLKTPTAHPEARIETQPLKASTINPPPPPSAENVPQQPATLPAGPAPAPAPGPTLDDHAATVTPFSPYTYTRQRLRELTMPPIPNFSIPDAPPAPPQNSEEAATLAATTKQFERFLELKTQGVHFNARLQTSSSLRNPSLLPKLLAFAGFEEGEGEVYASSLEGVPARWPEDCYVESLVRGNERRERKRGAEREGVEFVPARRE